MPSDRSLVLCDIHKLGDICHCGYKAKANNQKRICDVQSRGLGDYIGIALARVGITKERWARWTGKPTKSGCNACQQREQRLNRFGWKWQARANKVGWYLKHRINWLKNLFV